MKNDENFIGICCKLQEICKEVEGGKKFGDCREIGENMMKIRRSQGYAPLAA